MKAEITNNHDQGAGYATLKVTFNVDDTQQPGPEDQFLVAVEEYPSRIFLQPPGEDRWPAEAGECYHQPTAQSWDGDELILELGPLFTEAFRSKLHAFHVKGTSCILSNLRLSTAHIIRPTASSEGINLGLPPKATPTIEEIPIEETPVEDYTVEDYTVEDYTVEDYTVEDYTVEDYTVKDYTEETAPAPELSSNGNGKLVLIIILILALVIGGGFLLWHFLLKDMLAKTDSSPPPALTETVPAVPAPPEASALPEIDPLTEARTLLGKQSPQAELEEALTRLDAKEGAEDAVFLLVETMVSIKPEYRTRYASFFDPADPRPSGSIIKDPQMAYDEYEAAKNAGDSEAAAKQSALVEWAKDAASENEEARNFFNRLPEQR